MWCNMVKKEEKKEIKKKQKKLKSTGRHSERAKAYALRRFLNPTESKKQSLLQCNYSNTVNPLQVESQPIFKNTIEELKSLARNSKCSPQDQLTFFQKMRDNKKISPTANIESGKEINRMLGYHAPQQVDIQQEVTQNVSVLVAAIRTEGVSIADMIQQARQGVSR
jgi:hypothetical protein